MINVVEAINFNNDGMGDSSVFSCKIEFRFLGGTLFKLHDMSVRDDVIRSDITILFNAVVVFDNGETLWSKITTNMNKMMKNSYPNKTTKRVCCDSPFIIPIPSPPPNTSVERYVGSIVLIGKPTLEMFEPVVSRYPVGNTINDVIHDIDHEVMVNPNKALNDVKFVTDGGNNCVTGCRALLASISPVFNRMFCTAFKEGCTKNAEEMEVVLDFPLSAVERLVEFSLTRNYDVSSEYTDIDFVIICDKYMISHVVDKWCKFMLGKVSHNNVIDVYRMACLLGNNRLKQCAIRCIRNNPASVELDLFEKTELVEIFSTKC